MIKETLESPTSAQINLYSLVPVGSIKGIIQITHGMAEHGARYFRFAENCVSAGYAVFVHDLRGHGYTKANDAPLGMFGVADGFSLVLEDQNAIVELIKMRFPKIPIICFGHSLGAIIALTYAIKYPKNIDALVCWNKPETNLLAKFSKVMLLIEKVFRGQSLPSLFAWKLSYGAWNAKFKPNRTRSDWISQDEAEVDAYDSDPLCGFDVSISMWLDVLDGVFLVGDNRNLDILPKSLPIHLLGGAEDPCTNQGHDLRRFEKKLKDTGLIDVTCEILKNTRHESLNELNRVETTEQFLDWMAKRF
jgi:alpha-beta hydrolase superfamily lysophospholipase